MPRQLLSFLLTVLVCGVSVAQEASFEERLERGNALLRKGDFAGALGIFDELQVEEPNSPALHYSRGCALYEQAMNEPEGADPKKIEENLNAAKEAFEQAEVDAKGPLKTNAAYNRANTMAQMAKRTAAGGDAKAATEQFRESIQNYEDLLRSNPDHEKARHNLDHMRYAMKRFLQNPPPPPQQQQQQGDDKKDDQNQEQGDKQQQQQQQQQQQDQQEKQDQQQSNQNKNDNENQDKQSQPQEEQQNQPPPQGQDKAILKEQDLERENIEALLESLEEKDKSEQHDIRQGPRDHRLREEWW